MYVDDYKWTCVVLNVLITLELLPDVKYINQYLYSQNVYKIFNLTSQIAYLNISTSIKLFCRFT